MNRRSWSEEQLRSAVAASTSYRQVLSKLSLREAGGNYAQIKKYILEFGVKIDHFKGRTWNKGLNKDTSEGVAKISNSRMGHRCYPHCGRRRFGYRQDLGNYYFRSTWEANFARILNVKGIDWQYEPKRFKFSDCTYLPDFYLPKFNTWIEVKGYMSDLSLKKINLFKEISGVRLFILNTERYNKLKSKFSSTVPNWEFVL